MSENKSEERDVDNMMIVLDAYNQAENIFAEIEQKKVKIPEPLNFIYFDSKDPKDNPKDTKESKIDEEDLASETASLKSFGDSDDEDNSPNKDDTGQSFIDQVIFRCHQEYTISSCLMSKWDRKVYAAIRIKDKLPVVLIVSNDNVKRLNRQDIPREVRIMQHLKGHENVADILGWCPIDKRYYVIVMKYYEHCDVVTASEKNLYIVAKMMKSILTGLQYIHEKQVVHRDLAKDNILWNPITEQAVIIDFDTSCFFRPEGYFRNVGRDKYDAPEKTEVIEVRKELWKEYAETKQFPKQHKKMKAYTEKADMYSLGVLFWMLLNEKKHSPSPQKLKKWITKIKQKHKHKKYAELDLLVRMVTFDPLSRISPQDALNHPFIVDMTTKIEKDSEEFTHHTEMKKYLEKMLNNETMDGDDDIDLDMASKYLQDEDDDSEDDDDEKKKDPNQDTKDDDDFSSSEDSDAS